jgi:hypothetical protein
VNFTPYVDESKPHLGGYLPGGDEATWYPELWEWVVRTMEIKTVLDLGCGEGHALREFQRLGCTGIGVDGVPQTDPDIQVWDYTQGPYGGKWDYDLCWSCEFVEHVEEQFVPNFLPDFSRCKFVLMTHATPGQAGYHHVNCQTSDYWQGVLVAIGFSLDPVLTRVTRELTRSNTSPWNHYLRSGLAFRKNRF